MTVRVSDAFRRGGSTLLFAAGGAMVLLAVLREDREVVAAALVGFGAVLMSLAVLLPRLVGRLKLGAKGLEAELIAAVQEQAEAVGLSPEQTTKAIQAARMESDAWGDWLDALLLKASSGAPSEAGSTEPILRLAQRYVERERNSHR